MKSKAKALLAVLIAAMFFFTGCSEPSDFYPGQIIITDDGLYRYSLNEDCDYWVFYANGMEGMQYPSTIEVPARFKGIPVKMAFINNTNAVKVKASEGIEQLEINNCPDLESFNIPNSLREIGLYKLPKLTGSLFLPDHIEAISVLDYVGYSSIRFGENISKIPYYIKFLRYCSNLESVYIPYIHFDKSSCWEYWTTYLPSSCKILHEHEANEPSFVITEDRTAYIFTGFDSETTDISEFEIPSTHNGLPVTIIGSNAFKGCSSIKKVVIPSSIKKIHSNAFEASGIEEISIPSTVDEIEECAFKDCTALHSVELYEGFKTIPDNMFENCTSLEYIKLPSSLEFIGKYAFSCSGLKEMVLSENISYVKQDPFYGCENLESLTVPLVSQRSVGGWGDWGGGIPQTCTIHYSNNADELSFVISTDRSYYYCLGLPKETQHASIEIPAIHNSLPVVIPKECMNSVENLEEIIIQEGIRSIAAWAFFSCSNLKTIRIPASVSEIFGPFVIQCNSLADVYVAREQGDIPEKWSQEWNLFPQNCVIHYKEASGNPDPGTEPDTPEGLEPRFVFDYLDNGIAGLTQQVNLAAYGAASMPEGVSVDISSIQNNRPYTITMNGAVYEDDAVSIVFYGTYDYEFNQSSFTISEIINLTEGTAINGEAHTASWKTQGGSAGANTTDIIIDGSPYTP